MSVIKTAMLDAFVAAFQAALNPALGITVEPAAADWEEPQVFPLLRIVPSEKFNFEPWQEEELDDTQPGLLLLEVGSFSGSVELRVCARTKKERELIEDAVQNVLFQREGAPGVLVAQTADLNVGGYATAYSAPVALVFNDEEWREEMVFAKKRYSFLTCEADFPMLVMRTGVYTIEQLVLAFTDDINATTPEEEVIVNCDGTTSPTDL